MTDESSLNDPIKFAYWVPNVSGGLVVSKIEQRTDWSYEYNRKLAVLAENNGFEYALSQVRYIASYGAAYQHESTSFSLALLLATQRLKVIAAIHPGLWHPGVLAKFIVTADQISGGRAAVNVVSGWFKDEFTKLGEPWLEHDERYRRSEEFIRVLRELWTSDHAEFNGDFYRLHDFDLEPKPVVTPARPHPEIFQGGNSSGARRMAGRVSDWYFSNGKDFDGFTEQIRDVNAEAAQHNRRVRFGLNGFLVARDTEAEAREVLREIIDKADREAVEGFGSAVKQAGQSTSDGKGMWQDSEFADLVQYNDGFRTGLVGTPEQIATRIIEYKKRGANLSCSASCTITRTSSTSASACFPSCARSKPTSISKPSSPSTARWSVPRTLSTTVVVGNPKPRSRTYETAVSLADGAPAARPRRRSALYLIDRELDDSPALTGWLDAARPRLAGLGVLT